MVHNNREPYIVVNVCIKVKDIQTLITQNNSSSISSDSNKMPQDITISLVALIVSCLTLTLELIKFCYYR